MPWNIPFRSDPFPGNSVLDAYNSIIAILNERLDGLDPEHVRITGGTIDGTVIGGTVPAAGYFTTLRAGGDDVVTLNAIQTLTQKTLTSPDINGGTLDGAIINSTSIGMTTPAAGAFTAITLGTALAIADGGTGASDAATARTNLGLAIGTNVQAWSAILDALSALTAATDTLPYFSSATTAATTGFTAFARTLLDDADAAAMRTTLGLVIGTNVQAYDASLQSISSLTNAANQIIYTTSTDTFANAPISAGGRALINTTGAANAIPYYTSASAATTFTSTAAGRAMVGLTGAADLLGYFTSASAAATTSLTASGRSLIGLTGATDQMPYFSASATAGVTALTAFGRSLIAAADAAAARAVLAVSGVDPRAQGGRLTLTTGVPVTTADVTGATTVYFTPYESNLIALYTGGAWVLRSFTEIAHALGTVTAGLPYDFFAYDNAGTPAVEKLAWASATARATTLTRQDGVLVKSGDATRRYLGTIFTTSTTTTADAESGRYVWNYYNRVTRQMRAFDPAATWNYTTATTRQANANTANQLNFVVGVAEDAVDATVTACAQNSSAGVDVQVSIGYDSTTVNSTSGTSQVATCSVANAKILMTQQWRGIPSAGRHFLAWLEWSTATGTTTWRGGNTGILGSIRA